MTVTLLPDLAALFLIAFARIGALVMLMPGVGDRAIPVRARLAFALLLTLVLLPLVRPQIALAPLVPERLFAILVTEVLIGLMLGAAVRVALASMQIAGTIVATQLGLSFAAMVDPTSGNQNPVIATFLVLLAAVMVFALDLHHLAIRGIADSYRMLTPGELPATGDVAQYIATNTSAAFRVGVQVSAPFLVFGIVFNLGLGVLSRLMPQLQIFFLALPATIMIGTLILIAAIGVMVGVFLAHLQAVLGQMIVR